MLHLAQRSLLARRITLAVTLVAVCLMAAIPLEAAGQLVNQETIRRIDYSVPDNAYLIRFNGTPNNTENCSGSNLFTAYAVIKASQVGQQTDQEDVSRLINQIYFAMATGRAVKIWVNSCEPYGSTDYPKIYNVQIVD